MTRVPMTGLLTIDPELHGLIPPLTELERERLEQNILADGCRDPLAVWQGILLDGHNRLEICETHGLPYATTDVELADRDAAKLWIIDNQFGRRNLTDGTKWELMQARREILLAKGKQTQGQRSDLLSSSDKKSSAPHDTRKAIAADLGWSTGKVGQAAQVYEYITETGDDELRDSLRTGKETIGGAYKKAKIRRIERVEGDRIKAWYAEADANMLTAEHSGTWAWGHREELKAELRKGPRFIEMQAEVDRRDQEYQDAEEVAQKAWAAAQIALDRYYDAARKLDNELARAMNPGPHGFAVKPGEVKICPRVPGNSSLHARFARHVGPERYAEALKVHQESAGGAFDYAVDEAIFRAAGLCLWCRVGLTPENTEPYPDKPGYVYLVCHWCREHRGTTHCFDCGAPLPEGDGDGFCRACDGNDDVVELQEDTAIAAVAALEAALDGGDE